MCLQRTQRITRIAFPISFQIDNGVFIAKFVVSRCMFANFQWVFLFCQSFEVGAVSAGTKRRSQVTGQVTGHRAQVTGHRLQVTGHRAQVIGHRKRSKNS